MSDSLWPHGLQHARLPCPSLFPGVCSNSCPASQRCYPTISSSAIPFLSCPQSFTASTLYITWPKYWSFSISLFNEYSGWLSLRLTGLISLQSKGRSRVFSNTTVQKRQFFGAQLFFIVQLSHPYKTTGKTIALNRQTFVGKVMSLPFNMLSKVS